MTKEESLAVITNMIAQTKKNYSSGSSFYFLLWGWVVMLADFSHYILMKFTDIPHPELVWLVTFPAGIISAIYSVKQRERALAVTHLDKVYGKIWIAVGIAIIMSIIFMSKVEYNHGPIILLNAGVGTFISGSLLRFRPLVFGGIALWVASLIAFNVPMVDQYLVGGFGIFAGYLIPGYMLKRVEK